MEMLGITAIQEKKMLEMCEDLFPEYCNFDVLPNGIVRFEEVDDKLEIKMSIYWFELCVLELPKRISHNGKSVFPEDTQYRIYESMSKRMLNIHATYKHIYPKHPVDYLYEEFKKIHNEKH